MLFIVMKIVIARFQHCRGGRGLLIPVMPLAIVSKMAYQRIFQLFDPVVPRTFVEDCSKGHGSIPGLMSQTDLHRIVNMHAKKFVTSTQE